MFGRHVYKGCGPSVQGEIYETSINIVSFVGAPVLGRRLRAVGRRIWSDRRNSPRYVWSDRRWSDGSRIE